MRAEPTTDPEFPSKEMDEERAAYRRVLDSGFFDRAPILSRLLSSLCDKYFEGSAQEIKESTIAIEVFHRTVDFDSRHDTIVRVNINRLRDALTRFYNKEGKDHLWQITIPSGQYVPVFKDISPATDGSLHLRFTGRRVPAILSGLEILPGTPGKMLPLRMTAQPAYYLSPEGVLWEPDHYSWGGQIVHRQKPVTGSLDSQLFRAEHFGNFHYVIPVPPGQYQVNLYFAETFFGPSNPGGRGSGIRHFNVFCNGQALLRNFDIFQEAGGENRSILKTFHGLEPNAQGKLNLDFVPIGNLASLCALEVLPE